MKKIAIVSLAVVTLSLTALGCSSDEKVVHKEVKDEPRLLGGRKIESNTTIQHSDGSTSTEKRVIKTP